MVSSVERNKTAGGGSGPQRQSTKRVDSAKVMGKKSYVIWRKLTWAESKAFTLMQRNDELTDEQKIDATQTLLQEHIAEWNWVDEDGVPMPLPTADNGVFENLNDDETAFLVGLVSSGKDPKA